MSLCSACEVQATLEVRCLLSAAAIPVPVCGADIAEGDAGMCGLAVSRLQRHTHSPVVLHAPMAPLQCLYGVSL